MYVLVREDEAERHKRELKNSIEPQIHQLLKLADAYSAEQEKLEAELREQVCRRPFISLFHSSLLIPAIPRLPRIVSILVSERLIPSSSLRPKTKACPKGSEPPRDGKSFCGNIEIGLELKTRSRRKFWPSW